MAASREPCPANALAHPFASLSRLPRKMKHFPTLLSHEIRMLLVTPATYVAATLFLGFMGMIFSAILEKYSGTPQEYSPARIYFEFFWLPVCVMVPLLTMKCLAE